MRTFFKNWNRAKWSALVITTAIFAAGAVIAHAVENGTMSPKNVSVATADGESRVNVPIHIAPYAVEQSGEGHELRIEGFGHLPQPGVPDLPSRIFAVAIPPGAVVTDVTFEHGEGITLPGNYWIEPVGLPRVISNEDPTLYRRDMRVYEENVISTYGTDEPYPGSVGEFVRRAGYRKYNLVDVRITPFHYHPVSGRLIFYPDVTVNVHYTIEDGESHASMVMDHLPNTENIAREIIVNYDQVRDWYRTSEVQTQGPYDFVVITLQSLTSAVTPLTNWEVTKGRTVQVVTTDWINSNYTGVDLAEKMRNFLRDKYPSGAWGIEDVLLIGHYDDVPMRNCWQNVGYGRPDTDYYYAELSLPDNQSWDADGDQRYGETGQDPIDFYTEINVGRIPWSDYAKVESICNKSVAYEQNSDRGFKKNILLLGAYFWSDTDNAVLMEYKVDPDLHPWMSDWTMTRMYEQNSDYWSDYECDYPLLHSNVMDVWPNGKYAFVNWAGHGSPTSCHIYGLWAPAFISSTDCSSLNDSYPAIIFADACSNSDTDYLNIGQAMIDQGAVGFLGSTEVAYGMPAWNHPNDGSSQSFDYYFTTCVTSGDYSQGGAHQWALRQMYTQGLWYYTHYEMFEWGAIWGNPDLGMGIDESYMIVDNSGSNFFILNGSWSSGEHPNANYGSASFVREPGGERSAGWRVNTMVSSGTYEVYTWKFEHEYMHVMATNAPFKVYHANGESDWILVDQSTPNNEWIYLGTFEFNNDSTQGVMITDNADGAVIADAIKLVRTGP
jgi:hypothetical protein